MRTEAERHRLILGHFYLVPMLASGFRGARGIPFDELEGAGRIGLCEAASDWNGKGEFGRFCNAAICNQIKDFIRAWSAPLTDEELDTAGQKKKKRERIYIWQTWSDRDFINALAERWEFLSASIEDMNAEHEKLKFAAAAIKAAMIGFSREDRDILNARYFSDPPSTIDDIAREHEISYAKTVRLIDRMLKKIRKIFESYEAATPTAARG